MATSKSSSAAAAYVESEDHVPDPTDMRGIFRTDGLGGHERIEDVSPIFEQARHDAAVQAGRAIDPDDPTVPQSAVVFPETSFDRDAAVAAIKERAAADPPSPYGPGPSARAAGEETSVDDASADAAGAADAHARGKQAKPSVTNQSTSPATPGATTTAS